MKGLELRQKQNMLGEKDRVKVEIKVILENRSLSNTVRTLFACALLANILLYSLSSECIEIFTAQCVFNCLYLGDLSTTFRRKQDRKT